MRSWRILGFGLAIVTGLAMGLLAGWLLFPSAAETASPTSLRADYKADLVLMTAEVFARDADLAAAIDRLRQWDGADPLRTVQSAIVTAQQMEYAPPDVQILAHLYSALQAGTPVPLETQP